MIQVLTTTGLGSTNKKYTNESIGPQLIRSSKIDGSEFNRFQHHMPTAILHIIFFDISIYAKMYCDDLNRFAKPLF